MAALYSLLALLLSVGNVTGGRYDSLEYDEDTIDASSSKVKFPYNSLRLPGDVLPEEYNLFLHPNITDGKFSFTGNVNIHLSVQKETDAIILHSHSLLHTYTSVYEDELHGKEVPVRDVLTHDKHELVMVRLWRTLSTKKKYVLHIIFRGVLSQRLRGFYRSSYKTEDGQKRYLATSHFEPTGARLAFPCFDEPAMKAKFSIRIVREEIHTALSNMPIDITIVRSDGLLEDRFMKSVKMSTYLVAFIVSDFAHLSTKSSRGVKIKVWAPKHLISQAAYAIEVTPKILDYYEHFFKVDFPLPKQDLIAIPDFAAGAMENWGLITYRLTALLYDEKQSSSASKQRVVEVIAHELAHQWFGNLVTMKWWNDLWLNEGFARFVQFIGTSVVTKGWELMDQFVHDNLQRALALDSRLNSHPISVPVSDPNDIGGLFDGISYSKGASIIGMMRDFIGADRFVNGLAAYLKENEYGNAVSDDLWASLSAATDNTINVKKIMDTWTLQMGYPVVNVIRENKNVALITQERFVTDIGKGTTPSPFNYKWEVPVTFYYQNKKEKQLTWLTLKDESVKIRWPQQSGWLKVNVDEIGFYRVNYDAQNWKALNQQLTSDHQKLSPADRSNLLDDAFALASTGKLSYEQALDLTKYLVNEKHYVPCVSAYSALAKIGGLLHGRPGYAKYESYLLRLLTPLAKELGWKDEGTHLNKFLRSLVFANAVKHNMHDAVVNTTKMYKSWMEGKTSIPPNLRAAVYLAGIKYGGEEEWDFMYAKYKSSIYPSEKSTLMYTLASTSNVKKLQWYLDNSIKNDVIRSQDTCLIISRIAANPIGTEMARKFVMKHWSFLYDRYGHGDGLSRVVPGVFGAGKTQAELTEAENFLDNHELGSARLSAKRTLASIHNNINWLEKNEEIVVGWLKKNI